MARTYRQGNIPQAEIIRRETAFSTLLDPSTQYPKMIAEIARDVRRNRLIVDDVIREAGQSGGARLVLSDRTEHREILAGLLKEKGIEAAALTSDVKKKKRRQIIKDLNARLIKVVV